MRILLLGSAGRVGNVVLRDLLESNEVSEVIATDKNIRQLKKNLKKRIVPENKDKITFCKLDVKDKEKLIRLMRPCDAVINCVPYYYNLEATKCAISACVSTTDPGGSEEIVSSQLKLNKYAKQKNITVIPDCGLSPGITNILVKYASQKLDTIYDVRIKVGGIPEKENSPLKYKLLFPAKVLLDIYTKKVKKVENGKIVYREALSEVEKFRFGRREYECALTEGLSTLPYSFRKVKNMDYKTIRYEGHFEIFKLLLQMDFGNEKKLKVGNKYIVPREFFATLLEKKFHLDAEKDIVILKLEIKGEKEGKKINYIYSLLQNYNTAWNVSAMSFTTGIPLSVVGQWLASKRIKKCGVLPPEKCIEPEGFIRELSKRGILIKESSKHVK